MNPLKKLREKSYGSVIENTFMLIVLQFSNIAMSLVTSGFQSRVFGGTGVGIINVAQKYMIIFQLIIDFGFIISATGKVSKNHDDKEKLGKILSCVTLAKIFLIGVTALIMAVMIMMGFINIQTPQELSTYWIYLISTAFTSLLPDYMYRGLEKMSIITIRSVSIKAFATILIFIFVRKEYDYYMIPLFTAIGNFGGIFVVYRHLFKKMDIHFKKVKINEVLMELKESGQFFISRIASTVYGSVNTIILTKLVDPTKVLSGYYSSADTVISAARNGVVAPIADSIYPYTMRNKNLKIVKKALLIVTPVVALGCAIFFIFAEPICVLWLGTKDNIGYNVVAPLRALLPVVVISVPNYILGFPTLSPMGLAKYANYSVNAGTIFHLIMLALLYFSGNLGLVSIAILTCCTELLVLVIRVVVIYRNRSIFKNVS